MPRRHTPKVRLGIRTTSIPTEQKLRGPGLNNIGWSEAGHWEDHQDVQLPRTTVGESVHDPRWDEDAFSGSEYERLGSQPNGSFAGQEMQNLFAWVRVIEHDIARAKPLLTEIERGRTVGFVYQMLQRQVAGAAADRFVGRHR